MNDFITKLMYLHPSINHCGVIKVYARMPTKFVINNFIVNLIFKKYLVGKSINLVSDKPTLRGGTLLA